MFISHQTYLFRLVRALARLSAEVGFLNYSFISGIRGRTNNWRHSDVAQPCACTNMFHRFFSPLFSLASHLENKHLAPQHGHRVEIPIANIRGLVVGTLWWSVRRLRRRSRGRVVFSDTWRRGFCFRQGGASRGGGGKWRRDISRSGLWLSRGTVCRIWRFWRGIGGREVGAGGGDISDGGGDGGGRAGLLIRGRRGGRRSTSGEGRT